MGDALRGGATIGGYLALHLGNATADRIKIKDVGNHFTATDVEGALEELFSSVSSGKNSIASAITGMGQSASGSETFASLASKISAISSDANAGVGHVLSGYTFYQGGVKRTGTMTNRGGAVTVTPSTANQIKYAGYYSGNITILGDPDLVAANIVSGANIFNVAGSAKRSASGSATTATIAATLGWQAKFIVVIGANGAWLCGKDNWSSYYPSGYSYATSYYNCLITHPSNNSAYHTTWTGTWDAAGFSITLPYATGTLTWYAYE